MRLLKHTAILSLCFCFLASIVPVPALAQSIGGFNVGFGQVAIHHTATQIIGIEFTTTTGLYPIGCNGQKAGQLTISGQNAGDFKIVPEKDGISGKTCGRDQTLRAIIEFTPSDVGIRQAELNITVTADHPQFQSYFRVQPCQLRGLGIEDKAASKPKPAPQPETPPLTVYLGGAGMNGSYISDQIAALKKAGVKNAVQGNFSWGIAPDAIDVYVKRYHNYFTMDRAPFDLKSLGVSDNGETPLNFIGYSYGSLIAAQCAAYYATQGRKVGCLVLIGSPISGAFLAELNQMKSEHKIEKIIIVNLTQYTDQIYAGMSYSEFDHISLTKLVRDMGNGWGHFYYAPDNAIGKARRANLAEALFNDGLR